MQVWGLRLFKEAPAFEGCKVVGGEAKDVFGKVDVFGVPAASRRVLAVPQKLQQESCTGRVGGFEAALDDVSEVLALQKAGLLDEAALQLLQGLLPGLGGLVGAGSFMVEEQLFEGLKARSSRDELLSTALELLELPREDRNRCQTGCAGDAWFDSGAAPLRCCGRV